MKLIIAVVQGEDAHRTVGALTQKGVSSTRISSSGGFLEQGNVTLLIGVDDPQVDTALEVIRENCVGRAGRILREDLRPWGLYWTALSPQLSG